MEKNTKMRTRLAAALLALCCLLLVGLPVSRARAGGRTPSFWP